LKYRKDFVTNSSSSSYICEICGEVETAWDGLEEVNMAECVNGHVICQDHLLTGKYDDVNCVPAKVCPICQFIEYSEYDLAKYLEIKYGIDREKVFSEVKKVNRRRKKLYDLEYITYVCRQFELNPAEVVAGWKAEFGTYEKLKKYFRNNTKNY